MDMEPKLAQSSGDKRDLITEVCLHEGLSLLHAKIKSWRKAGQRGHAEAAALWDGDKYWWTGLTLNSTETS